MIELNTMRESPATYTTDLPNFFGSIVVGFPSSSMLIGVHFRVLHSNPNLPNAPADIGNRGMIEISHAKATIPIDNLRNLGLLSLRG